MISLIVCHDINNVIGYQNELPWHYKEDLQYFKKITTGKNVLFGKNTLFSIYNKRQSLLPNRRSICLTTNSLEIKDLVVYNNLDDLLKNEKEFIVCGGESIYKQFIDYCDVLYITVINKSFKGDTYFPSFDLDKFEITNKEDSGDLSFITYTRK